MNPKKQKKREARKRRKNSATGLFGSTDFLLNSAMSLAVTAVISDCSPQEKILLAALIPEFLRSIRGPKGKKGIASPIGIICPHCGKEHAINLSTPDPQRAETPGQHETEQS